jgi:hypothetical protein
MRKEQFIDGYNPSCVSRSTTITQRMQAYKHVNHMQVCNKHMPVSHTRGTDDILHANYMEKVHAEKERHRGEPTDRHTTKYAQEGNMFKRRKRSITKMSRKQRPNKNEWK